MRIRLEYLDDPNALIQAVKGVRSVTGLGLKQAKEIADAVNSGQTRVLEVDDGMVNWSLDYLNDHNVHAVKLASVVEDDHLDTARTVCRALANMPGHLRVEDVVGVLDSVL